MKEQIDKIRVSAGEDLLAFIPHTMGYWPEASVVCIGMAGKMLRATMRLDLPEDGGDAARLAEVASSQLASDTGSDGCLVAIFGREDWTDPGALPHAGLFRELGEALALHGLPVRDAWYVGTGHWRSIQCTAAECCPWPGKDIASIRESFVNAEFIYRGSMVREPPRQQIRELTTPVDLEFAGAVRAAGDGLRDELAAFGSGLHQMSATLSAWEHSLSGWPTTPDKSMAAYLLASLGDVNVRDAVMVALATSPRHALMGAAGLGLLLPDPPDVLVPANWYGGNQAACCPVTLEGAGEKGVLAAVHDFTNILVGDLSGRKRRTATAGPDWGRLDRAEPLLQFLARSTEGRDRAPVLCILGWIQWCKGRGTWAGHYFQACQASQPGYKLAGLLDQLLAVGYIAECAKDPRTAWHGHSKPDGREGQGKAPGQAA